VAGITAEAADAVVLADDPTRIADAIAISRRTMRIARQSIWAGLGLSGIAMGFAAAGFIPPVGGAVLQEVIDVAVILNAAGVAAMRRTRDYRSSSGPLLSRSRCRGAESSSPVSRYRPHLVHLMYLNGTLLFVAGLSIVRATTMGPAGPCCHAHGLARHARGSDPNVRSGLCTGADTTQPPCSGY
jgi:hypothetical protein